MSDSPLDTSPDWHLCSRDGFVLISHGCDRLQIESKPEINARCDIQMPLTTIATNCQKPYQSLVGRAQAGKGRDLLKAAHTTGFELQALIASKLQTTAHKMPCETSPRG